MERPGCKQRGSLTRFVTWLAVVCKVSATALKKGFNIMNNVSKGLILLIAGLSALATDAFASEAKGLVVASRGTVIATGVDDSRELQQGDEVFVEDEIMTGPKSFAVVQFMDGAKVTIKPNSEVVIEDYVYNGNADDKATLSLVSGGLRVITGAMAKNNPENYKVKTPVALMGVRGTEFAVQLCGDDVCEDGGIEVID